MRIVFSGVGEAFDERLGNTSLLVQSDDHSLLLDCGFTAAHSYWRTAENPLALDGVCLSHYHGDHYFGLPALLLRFVEEDRSRRLAIVGQAGVEDRVVRLMELAYPNVLAKKRFPIDYFESAPGGRLDVAGFALSFAAGDHPLPCLAVRAESGGRSVFFSGDGRPTPDTAGLARGCDLVVHEAFSLEPETPGHGTVASAVSFAVEAGARAVALVHVRRDVRHDRAEILGASLSEVEEIEAFLPNEGDEYIIGGVA